MYTKTLKLGVLVGILAGGYLQDAANAQTLLVRTTETSRPIFDSIEIDARARDGTRLHYSVKKVQGGVLAQVAMGKRKPVARMISLKQYPHVDLASIEVSYKEDAGKSAISLSFGEKRDCFSNYDGRDIVTVDFTKVGTTISLQSFEGCESK